MFKTRYTRLLEEEVAILRVELEKANLERQAAVNVLLSHMGAPTITVGSVERKAIPPQRQRNIPSIWRKTQEMLSRRSITEKLTQ